MFVLEGVVQTEDTLKYYHPSVAAIILAGDRRRFYPFTRGFLTQHLFLFPTFSESTNKHSHLSKERHSQFAWKLTHVGAARNPRSLLTADKIQNIRLDSADTNQNQTNQKDRASERGSDPGEGVSNNSSIRLFKSPLASEILSLCCHVCLGLVGWLVAGRSFRQGTRSRKPLGLSLSKPTNVAGMAGWWQSVLVAVLGYDVVPRMTLIQSLPPSSAHPSSTASSWALQAPDARSGCSGARLDPSRGQKRC